MVRYKNKYKEQIKNGSINQFTYSDNKIVIAKLWRAPLDKVFTPLNNKVL